VHADELAFAGLARQAELIASKEVSPRELVDACLERIEELNPRLNAFRVVFAERARAEAQQAEGRLGAGGAEDRPLLGVPVAIKDDVDVAGEVTARGSRAHGPAATHDAEVVSRLRAAGAIVIGKTNVPELEIFPFTESEAFGITRNPWNRERTTGGSSGGTAAAVATGMAGAGLGSDGGGSIRIPAACCGLFGIKPQRGRISLAPKREGWHGLSVIGPLARRVADAALFLDVTAGAATGDVERAEPPRSSFVQAASTPPGELRLAFSSKVPPGTIAKVGAEQKRALSDTAELLGSLGHRVVWESPEYGMASTAFAARYLRGIHDDAHGMAHFEALEPRTKGVARMGTMISPRLLARARRAEAVHAARINRIFDHVDVIVTPTLATSPPPVGRWKGKSAFGTLNGVARFVPFEAIWNHIGQPAATVPVGVGSDGMPLSVQLLGRPNDEATLLSLAAQMEAERPWADRRPSP
jgi:amidase